MYIPIGHVEKLEGGVACCGVGHDGVHGWMPRGSGTLGSASIHKEQVSTSVQCPKKFAANHRKKQKFFLLICFVFMFIMDLALFLSFHFITINFSMKLDLLLSNRIYPIHFTYVIYFIVGIFFT